MNRESNNPYPKERRRLYRIGCKWAKAPGVCELTGITVDPSEAHVHHILTRGSHSELFLCPWNWLVLHGEVHGEIERAGYNARKKAIERVFPGLYDRIEGLKAHWTRKPLYEVAEMFGELPPREEFIKTEMGRL